MASASALRPLLPLATARANHLTTDWDNERIFVPWFLGRRFVEPSLDDLMPHINWKSFLSASEPDRRDELITDAQQMLSEWLNGTVIKPRGVYGFWAANAVDDDIVVYKDDARASVLVRFHMLRQQEPTADVGPTLSLADFVAPKDSFAPDYIGAFAVTTGIALDEVVGEYEARGDGRSGTIAKALGAWLAEAFAEFLHAKARNDWGYGDAAKDRGIRPAFGHPACPDPTEKAALFRLLHAPEIGITLTDAFVTTPASSVCGIYLAHPKAQYFDVGRIGLDQIEDYARRKEMAMGEAERWLAPNVGY